MYGEHMRRIKKQQNSRNVSHATVNFESLLHLGRIKCDEIFIILFMSDPQRHFTMASISQICVTILPSVYKWQNQLINC